MYFASYTAEKNKGLIEETGMHVTSARLETIWEKGISVTFLWIVAQKPE